MTQMETSTVDATMPLINCKAHGWTVQAYLNGPHGGYGCILCNPTRPAFRGLPSVSERPACAEPVGDMPDWMC
jgi:hypothetical protein